MTDTDSYAFPFTNRSNANERTTEATEEAMPNDINSTNPNQDSPSSDHENWVEKQFHEQFAENYNSISSYVLTFVIGVLAVVAAFGFSCNKFLDENICIVPAFILLSLSYAACLFICGIVTYLAIKQGMTVRRDQFVVHMIRCIYYRNYVVDKAPSEIFPKDFHPFDKHINEKGTKKSRTNILIGTFQYIANIATVTAIAFSFAYLIIVLSSVCLFRISLCTKWVCFSLSGIAMLLISIALIILLFGLFLYCRYLWLEDALSKYEEINAEMKRRIIELKIISNNVIHN